MKLNKELFFDKIHLFVEWKHFLLQIGMIEKRQLTFADTRGIVKKL